LKEKYESTIKDKGTCFHVCMLCTDSCTQG